MLPSIATEYYQKLNAGENDMFESAFEADFEGLIESDEFDEFDEFGEFDESDERVRRRGRAAGGFRPGLRLPPRGNATVRPARGGYATKAELDATAKRLDGRIATNATAIKTLDGRTRTIERDVSAAGAALKKEIAIRKKETGDLRKSVDESRQIAMIMPLLGGGDDKFSKMLPLLLYGGMLGGSSGSTGSDNNSMMMTMMMVVAMQD
jgi:hypothetical protein